MLTALYRADSTNVGDWYCPPHRYFDLKTDAEADIIDFNPQTGSGSIILGGGGLVAKTFEDHLNDLAEARSRFSHLIAWGIGESLIVDRKGNFVPPYSEALSAYLEAFDLVGLRDYGTRYHWVPCASCMLEVLDSPPGEVEHDIVIYEHKRIPIPIEGFPKRTNDGNDIEAVCKFLASGDVVITNSYHGAYWATLLGKRVFAVPNMSKMYRFKHAPVIGHAEDWKRLTGLTRCYPEALEECRSANIEFYKLVQDVLA